MNQQFVADVAAAVVRTLGAVLLCDFLGDNWLYTQSHICHKQIVFRQNDFRNVFSNFFYTYTVEVFDRYDRETEVGRMGYSMLQ